MVLTSESAGSGAYTRRVKDPKRSAPHATTAQCTVAFPAVSAGIYGWPIDDAAAIWLYEPRNVLAIHSRITTSPMRPNAWWLGLADWSAQ